MTALARPSVPSPVVVSKGGKLVVRRGDRERELADSDGYSDYGPQLTPDGRFAVCGYGGGEFVRVWDAVTGEKKHDLVPELSASGGGSTRSSPNVSCAPDGRHVAVHEFNRTVPENKPTWHVSVWDVASGKRVRKLIAPGATTGTYLHWSGDSRTLLVTGWADNAWARGFVAVCDPFSQEPPRMLAMDHGPGAVALSTDGKSFAVAVGSSIEFWDIGGAALRYTLRTPPFGVTAMAFTPDGKQFITDGPDGTFLYPLPDLRRPPVAPLPRLIR